MVNTIAPTPLYDVPGYGEIIATLPADTELTIDGRSDTGLWLRVTDDDGLTGWVYLNDVAFDGDVWALPVVAEQVTILDLTPFPLDDDDDLLVALDRLAATPILHNFDSARLPEIFAAGQALGNRRGVFIKIGDSNTTTGDYLRPFGIRGNTCDFGAFESLRETIAFFAESPYPGFNSFNSSNVTAQNGLNTFAVFDSFWADADYCRSGESPLACEYRLLQPAVALTMIGLMDLEQMEVSTYAANLDRIVEWLIERGVIPVLSTFPVLPDYPAAPPASLWGKSVELNIAMLDVADAHGIPLVNLWAAFQHMPDYGIGPDRTHIRHQIGAFCDFTGAEARVGGTARNLLMLQALDRLRVDVIAP